MPTVISQERPDTKVPTELIAELEAVLSTHFPAESRHGYSVEKLIREGVAFFVIRHDGEPAGRGGIQLVGTEYGELQRMYVRPAFRGRALARAMIGHLAAYAREHGVQVLRLETGTHQHAATRLHEAAGLKRIGPFGPYHEDPLSLFLEKAI